MRGAILLLVLALGCLQASGPAACEVTAFDDQGVAVTYLKPSFTEVRKGSELDLYLEYQNIGEAVAKDIKVYDQNSAILGAVVGYGTDREIKGAGTSRLEPPDIERCVPGEIKKPDGLKFKVSDSAQKKKEGMPIKLALVYDYTTTAWSDILTLTREQWQVRREKDTMPETFEWVSAGPVKVHIEVPATPIVDTNTFLVKMYFTNEISGDSYPTIESTYVKDAGYTDLYCSESPELAGMTVPLISTKTKKNCIREVRITLPKEFEYARGGCDNCVDFSEEGIAVNKESKDANGNLVLTFRAAGITTAEQMKDKEPQKYYLQFKLTKSPEVEEIYKLRVEADYTYYTKYSTVENIMISE